MGQRLAISVTDRGEEIAAIYYHWSAYTAASLSEIAQLIAFFRSHKYDFGLMAKEDAQLVVISAAEANESVLFELADGRKIVERNVHGGVDEDDLAYAKTLFPGEAFSEDVNRNAGLVAITPENIARLHSYEEGTAEIDLTNQTFRTDVWDRIYDDEGAEDWLSPEKIEAGRNAIGPDLDCDYDWNDIQSVVEAIKSAPSVYSVDGELRMLVE